MHPDLHTQESHEQPPEYVVRLQVVGVAHTFVEVWEGVAVLLAEMDVLLGFAEVAVNAPTPYIRPQMLPPDEGELKLVGCRHPCVEAQEGVEFIKNDCCMTRGESCFQIITGPNMGGKSTYIRQVVFPAPGSLLCLILVVPASSC